MYCKYCGHIIDDDSTFCRHCGKNITINGHNNSIQNDLASYLKRTDIRINFDKDVIIRKTKSILKVIWKIIRTIFWVIIGIIAYVVLGFIMAPFIALFNAEIPSTGVSKRIENIWKKENTGLEEKPTINESQQ